MQDELNSISVLAVPNSQFKLKDIYVAQSLLIKKPFKSKREAIKINRFPHKLIKTYKKILITDTAGMGKSTILKYMFLDLINNNIKDIGIPIFIELNRLKINNSILSEIQEELNITKDFEKGVLLSFFQKGGFIFFLDGYDEISIADRDEVTKDIQTFISKTGTKNYYILASRPEESLASFGDFQSFTIQPLNKKEAFELLTKYDTSYKKKISKELIKELNTEKYKSIDEYLENPLLVSLLFTSFNYKAEIPLKKHQFYRQVFDALYSNHKLAQGKKPHAKRSLLDVDDFSRVLRYVGFMCLKRGKNSFDKDSILALIRDAKEKYKGLFEFSESNFLDDLLLAVPLFTKDGTEYKWAHKSLMEYFAARYVAEDTKQNQDKYLNAIYKSENLDRYVNMLDLYFDIDEQGFSKSILLPLLNDFVQYHDTHWPKNSFIRNELVEERIGLCYGSFSIGLTKHEFESVSIEERNYIEKILDENCNKDISFDLGIFGGYLLIRFDEPNPYNCLYDILVRKRSDLFFYNESTLMFYIKNSQSKKDFVLKNSNIQKIKRNYFKEGVHDVDIMDGCNNDLFYLINVLLIGSRIPDKESYFKYDSVKQEIDKINKEIEKYNDTSDLDGI